MPRNRTADTLTSMYQRYDSVTPATASGIPAARVLAAVAGVIGLSMASLFTAANGILVLACGLDDIPATGCSENAWGLAWIAVGGLAWLGTGPLTGWLLQRWWAWLMPLWLGCAGFAMLTIAGVFL